MVVWLSDTIISVLSVLDVSNDSFWINPLTLSLFYAKDSSKGGGVTFGGFNVTPLKYLALSSDIVSWYVSDNRTLIFADFNIVE